MAKNVLKRERKMPKKTIHPHFVHTFRKNTLSEKRAQRVEEEKRREEKRREEKRREEQAVKAVPNAFLQRNDFAIFAGNTSKTSAEKRNSFFCSR